MESWLQQNATALIGHVLTLIGIGVAAIIVVWQLGRQHRSSLHLHQENAREELKLRLHEVLVAKVRNLSRANGTASMYAFMIPFNIENFQRQLALGASPWPVGERNMEFLRLHNDASGALVQLIEEFEAWSVAFPGLEIFQVALNAANHSASEAFSPLFSGLLGKLPVDLPADPNGGVAKPLVPKILSDEELWELKVLVDQYKNAMDEIGSYVQDLTVESQNNLLSGLFGRRATPRRPIDPKLKVISTEPSAAQELLRYFENETSWGRNKKAIETEVRSRLETP